MSDNLGPFLSLILRHKPEAAGISLDPNGWAGVDELIEGVNKTGKKLTHESLDTIVRSNNKRRYEYSEDKKHIRASQGHSVNIDAQQEELRPPMVLYHGTAQHYVANIITEGLKPQKRIHVHLSDNLLTASQVGKRHGELVILKVEAQLMYEDGIKFYKSANGVWLTIYVNPKYIKINN